MKKRQIEEEFSDIAGDAVLAAEGVACPFEDFVYGLETILDIVRDRLLQAQEEWRAKQGEDEDENEDDSDDGNLFDATGDEVE